MKGDDNYEAWANVIVSAMSILMFFLYVALIS